MYLYFIKACMSLFFLRRLPDTEYTALFDKAVAFMQG